jgi:hypothetical protein
MRTRKNCRHCERYFTTLARHCTAYSYGECDCPKCQGMCDCPKVTVEPIYTARDAMRDDWYRYGE